MYDSLACPCGSSLPFAFCHQPILEAPSDQFVDVARREYAEAWSGNAAHYAAQGLYQRLAHILAGNRKSARMIDVGCGRGDGMAALRHAMSSSAICLIGLDENPACLAAAGALLQTGKPHQPAHRLRHRMRGTRAYDQYYEPGRLPSLTPIALVQTDILRPDAELDEGLAGQGTFDAVTLWFTGIHKAREHDVLVRTQNLSTDELHGIAVELATFVFAARHLRSGGLLQIVSRGAHSDLATIKNAFGGKMRAMADNQPFSLIDLQALPYSEPATGRRLAVGSLTYDARSMPKAAVSAIFRRD
jgi:SAM-dependent methyltransferase